MNRPDPDFPNSIAHRIWAEKYRLVRDDGSAERDIGESRRRIAAALAVVEHTSRRAIWEGRFRAILDDFLFLPGGRIQAGAGSGRRVTLFNCFVMGTVEDSLDGIFRALHEGAITLQQGGGIGCDFSTLRPAGSRARESGTVASGPLSFMRIWDSMCATLISGGNRRGAMMGTLRCDHPDVIEFVEAKRDPGELRNFNLSVLVTDAFMEAVHRDAPWPLVFPAAALDPGRRRPLVHRPWSGAREPVPCAVVSTVGARDLWTRMLRAAYDCAEPGVLFIDRINQENNLGWCESISTTNPCGEVPLPPYGACNLGAINLTRFVRAPFSGRAELDLDGIAETAAVAVRLLDNVIDASGFPLPRQGEAACAARRIGLGITGLGDALILLGLAYGSPEARATAAVTMRTVCESAYRTSVGIAREKGPFPRFKPGPYLASPFVRRLPEDIREAIRVDGIRNSHLTSIAPAGTISLLAGNVSGGIEPVHAFRQQRTLRGPDGAPECLELTDYAYGLWLEASGDPDRLPPQFVDAADLSPEDHLAMQAAMQPWVDGAISKTINVPHSCPLDAFRGVLESAYAQGLKGCTLFRPNPVTGAIIAAADPAAITGGCCGPEREGD